MLGPRGLRLRTFGKSFHPWGEGGRGRVVVMFLQTGTNNPHSKMTDVYEGSLIRLFRRLEELIRQMAQAAKVMGSEELEKKFEQALTMVRRDIVAAQSLYL
jgi:superfamily II RNA helicase